MNSCKISGPLGRDAEIVQFEGTGSYQATLSIATHRFKSGVETTDWHTVVVKHSELVFHQIRHTARRGVVVEIEGQLIYESFTTPEGAKVRLPKIIVRDPDKFKIVTTGKNSQ